MGKDEVLSRPNKLGLITKGERHYEDFLKYRMIILDSTIDEDTARRVAFQLIYLDEKDNENPIQIWIDSDGGLFGSLCFILAVMKTIKAPVHAYVVGEACSAAFELVVACDYGYAFDTAVFMFHDIRKLIDTTEESQAVGKAVKESRFWKKHNDYILSKIAARTNFSLSKLKSMCEGDNYFNAKEMLKKGVIDEIIET